MPTIVGRSVAALQEIATCWKPFCTLRSYLPRRGFFVEAGANNGVKQSNTYGLERWQGWRGLLVEPVPELAAHCRQKRPGSIVENYALVSSDFSGESIEMFSAGLMSVVAGHLGAHEDQHLREASTYQSVVPERIVVPVSTLGNLLERHAIERVDFLSLDMEGYEAEALGGLGALRPEYILIENPREKALQWLEADYAQVVRINDDILFRLRRS